jgi:branched-chain amino acid transport system substrate-binding protein
MHSVHVLATCFGLASLVAVAACGSSGGGAASSQGLPKVVKIGVISSQSGPEGGPSNCGITLQSAQLAVANANKQHFLGAGTQLQIVAEDDQSTQSGAVTGYHQLISAGVAGIVGPCLSDNAETLAASIDSQKMPTIVSEASAANLFQHQYIFDGAPPQRTFAGNTISVLAREGVKTVSIIYTNDQSDTVSVWENAWKPQLSKLGIKILGVYPFPQTESDISSAISRIESEHPDAIGLDTFGPLALTDAVGIRKAGLSQPLFGQIVFDYPFYLSNATATSAGGAYFATSFAPTAYPPAKTFYDQFQAKFHLVPSAGAAQDYDGAWRLIRAIKSANSTSSSAILAALEAQQKYSGVEGQITYTNRGHNASSPGFVFLAKGKDLIYKPLS